MSNQNTNNNTDKKSVKMYASLALYALLGLALGYAVAKGVLYLINRPKMASGVKVENRVVAEGMTTYTGNVSQVFEGDNKAEISFDHNKTYTVSQGVGAKSKYFYVSDVKGMLLATIYMSFEGGRGYTAENYLNEVLKKAVPSIVKDNSATGAWTVASSANSEWHVKESDNKQWLVVVENTKANSESVKSVLETFSAK